jgi:hypothetical protein
MKTHVSETSLSAYHSLKREGKITPMQQRIVDSMDAYKSYTRKELATVTNMELSSVCGRVNELLAELDPDQKLIMECGTRLDEKTGKRQGVVRLVPRQKALIQ